MELPRRQFRLTSEKRLYRRLVPTYRDFSGLIVESTGELSRRVKGAQDYYYVYVNGWIIKRVQFG